MLPTIETWPGYSGILRKLSQGRLHLTWHWMVPSRHLSDLKPLFYQWRDWHYWSMNHLTNHTQRCPCPTMGADTAHGNEPEHVRL